MTETRSAQPVVVDQATGPSLKVINIEPTDREHDVLDLLQQSMAGGAERWTNRELWQWKHVRNHFGRSLVLTSEAEDRRIAGLRAFMRWRLRAGDRTFEAFRPVDTATHPDFRRMGIFSKLTLRAVEDARAAGGQIIFNTPNSLSISGYLKMGWTQVGVTAPMVRVNSYPRTAISLARRIVRKRLGRSQSGKPATFGSVPPELLPENVIDDRFDGLLQKHRNWQAQLLATDTSTGCLLWRYSGTPVYQYAVLTEEVGGELAGACVVRPAPAASMDTVVFEDFFMADPSQEIMDRLVSHAMDAFRPHVGSAFAAEGTEMRRFLRGAGFRWRSRSSTNLVANPLVEGISPSPSSISNWALGMSELEIF